MRTVIIGRRGCAEGVFDVAVGFGRGRRGAGKMAKMRKASPRGLLLLFPPSSSCSSSSCSCFCFCSWRSSLPPPPLLFDILHSRGVGRCWCYRGPVDR
jgi:hypothetical protein